MRFKACLLSTLAAAALGACAQAPRAPGGASAPFDYPAEEAKVNSAPHTMCVDQCLGTTGGNSSTMDREFCEQRCTF